MSDRYASLKQGLVGCWIPSISGSGLLLPDLSGRNNHGALTNMDASDWVSAQYGRAMDFDGVNDRVTLPNDFQRNAQSGAISAWFKFAGNGTNQNPIVSLGGNANLTVFAFRRRDTADANQNAIGLRIFSNNAPGGSNTEIFSTDKVNNGVWAHGLIQSNGSKYDLFVNGIRQTMIFTAGSDNGDWLADMTGTTGETICDIGAQWASGSFFSSLNGQLDDIRIYNRALTEPEIKLLSSEPGIGFKPAKKLSRFSQRFTYNPPKPRNYGVVRVKETDYATLRQGLVGAWCPSLPNGGSGNTLPDVSGYGNHGTLTNMSPDDWVSSQYGRALDFDGVNDYVDTGTQLSFLDGNSEFTMCFWGQRRSSGAALTVGKRSGGNYILIAPWIDGNVYFELTNYFPAVASNLTSWAHYAMTLRGATIRGYINGSQVVSAAGPSTVPSVSANYVMGLEAGVSRYSDGGIDDFRIYNRALSESEIRLLASRPGIGLRQESHRQTFYQFPSGARRKRILTGMP